jgi:hypothetical protein
LPCHAPRNRRFRSSTRPGPGDARCSPPRTPPPCASKAFRRIMERAVVAAGIARQAAQGSAGRNVSSGVRLRIASLRRWPRATPSSSGRNSRPFQRGAKPPLHAPRIRGAAQCHREAAQLMKNCQANRRLFRA